LKNDVGAPPPSEGVNPIFNWISQSFFNRF
jgi:hypothetical protein